MRIAHDLARDDSVAVEQVTHLQIREPASVRGGVGRADRERGAIGRHDADHHVPLHGPAHDREQGYRHDGAVVLAEYQVPAPEIGDGAVARGRGDRRVG